MYLEVGHDPGRDGCGRGQDLRRTPVAAIRLGYSDVHGRKRSNTRQTAGMEVTAVLTTARRMDEAGELTPARIGEVARWDAALLANCLEDHEGNPPTADEFVDAAEHEADLARHTRIDAALRGAMILALGQA